MKKILVFVVIFCCFDIALADYPVEIVRPIKQDLTIKFKAFGLVEAEKTIRLSAAVSGQIDRIDNSVILGKKVKKLDKLFFINDLQYRASVAQAKTNFQQAKLELLLEQGKQTAAQSEAKFLSDKSLLKPANKALIMRKPYLNVAIAKVNYARSQLKFIKSQLKKTVISAPCNGFIVKKTAQLQEFVGVGQQLAEVACSDVYKLIVNVPTKYYQWFKGGYLQNMQANLAKNLPKYKQNNRLKIVHLLPLLQKQSRSMQVYLQIQKPIKNIYPILINDFVTVDFTLPLKQQVVSLPLKALRGVSSVWIADKENTLVIKKVNLLHQDTTHIYLPADFDIKQRIIVNQIANPINGISLKIKG